MVLQHFCFCEHIHEKPVSTVTAWSSTTCFTFEEQKTNDKSNRNLNTVQKLLARVQFVDYTDTMSVQSMTVQTLVDIVANYMDMMSAQSLTMWTQC